VPIFVLVFNHTVSLEVIQQVSQSSLFVRPKSTLATSNAAPGSHVEYSPCGLLMSETSRIRV